MRQISKKRPVMVAGLRAIINYELRRAEGDCGGNFISSKDLGAFAANDSVSGTGFALYYGSAGMYSAVRLQYIDK